MKHIRAALAAIGEDPVMAIFFLFLALGAILALDFILHPIATWLKAVFAL